MPKDRISSIRADYYTTLRSLLTGLGQESTDMAPHDLSSALERATTDRMRPSGTWFLSGISGAWKTSMVAILRGHGYEEVPNITIRTCRPGESGNSRVFMDEPAFAALEAAGGIYRPHITNGVQQWMRREDMERLARSEQRLVADKSVPSLIAMTQDLPALQGATFMYVLAPDFEALYARMKAREGRAGFSDAEILDRFEEEITQLALTPQLPYTYWTNDSLERFREFLDRLSTKTPTT